MSPRIGRTEQLVRIAIQAAREGRLVCVFAPTEHDAKRLRARIAKACPAGPVPEVVTSQRGRP